MQAQGLCGQMALVKGKQMADENGDHRVSQNAVMEDLASNIHVSFSSIKHWVNGHNSPGSLEIVSQIASYFNVKTEQLLMPVQIEKEEYDSLEELRYYGLISAYVLYVIRGNNIFDYLRYCYRNQHQHKGCYKCKASPSKHNIVYPFALSSIGETC